MLIGLLPEEDFLRIGNCCADTAAKRGDLSQPAAPFKLQESISKCVHDANKAVAKLSAHLLPLWPRLELDRVQRVAPPRPQSAMCGRESGPARS
eukprot:1521125-Pyramimonas_sp.AAC.1